MTARIGRIFVPLWLVLSMCAAAAPQQPACGVAEVTFGIMMPDGRTIRGVSGEALRGEVKGRTVAIDALAPDVGPRRLLIVANTGKTLNPGERQAEVEVISYIVARARAEDSFALLTVRGPAQEIQFGAPREALIGAIKEVANPPKVKPRDENALDAILRGIGWFGEARPGDSVLLLSPDFGLDEKRHYGSVANALAQHRIRLFSVLFGPVIAGSYGFYWSPGEPQFYSYTDPSREHISALSWTSGGYMIRAGSENPWRDYKFTPGVAESLRRSAGYIYEAVVQTYVARVRFPALRGPERWKVDLTQEVRGRFPTAKVLYPRLSVPCLVNGTAK